ncbi:MAG TPA: FkbM family methyltransferase [Solirubrobacteraceae bacterium]|jgi:FkbM family methyltransferase|nr:FkbM family methyltransferase [Solirubrobacteraceae bacterium]
MLLDSEPVQVVARTVRSARAVSEPVRFTALQLAGPRRESAYSLRRSGLTVHLRHRTRDLAIFKEIFGANAWPSVYEPPTAVESIVAAADEPRVLDVGANIGLFGIFAVERWGASVESFEPDPGNVPLLRRTIAANGLQSRWTLREVAVSNRDGELPFVSGLFAESQLSGVGDPAARAEGAVSLSKGHTISVPVVDLFETNHDVELLKMDIEGAEWDILTDPRLSELKARAIVLEWHSIGCPEPHPHEAAVRLLAEAGYEAQQDGDMPGATGMLWAWRAGAEPPR